VNHKEQVLALCKLLYDKKAQEIQAIYVGEKTILAEWFVVASGFTSSQVKSLSDELEAKAFELGLELRRKEGYSEARWIVLDFADVLVHIFHPDERKFYNMERLWIGNPRDFIDFSREQDEREAAEYEKNMQ